ncbi:flagellar hook-associated protein FlgK [Methylocystis echinoides]|uniref:flagellar hook-associated protein FlgK n=1 Tax=Methylocystis echinoides TaxID=29468 RepID=UPI0034149C6D
MSLSSAGAIALRSLGVVSNQINVTSRNIAGAGVTGVNVKHALLASDEAGVEFLGVGRATNVALFRNLLSASAHEEAATAVSDALSRIDQALNLSDSSNSRSASTVISKLKSALQAYSATPQNETAAELAISAARNVVAALNDATAATQKERFTADEGIASAVSEVNSLLEKFATYNTDVVEGTAAGADVTDILDRRDALLTEISKRIGVTAVSRPNNDVVIYTDSGVTLFETTPRKLTFQPTPTLTPSANGAAVYVDGVQVTGAGAPLALRSGSIVGMAQIRDEIAPLYQSQLDEIARGLVVAFAERDQSGGGGPDLPGLFTYPGATQSPAATLLPGLAGQIVLNANVDPIQGGDLARLRDGGASGNPAYVYNTTGAPGYANRLIELVNAPSENQNFDPAAGLGPSGSVEALATDSNGWIAGKRQQLESTTTYYEAVVSQTTQALSNATGVNLDDQMSQMLALENSYQASAKLLEAVNAMFTALFSALRS